MSNNEPDYDNLAFDPSALNPCNDGKRGSDVLMTTLMKCQAIVAKNVELEKKLKIAKGTLEICLRTYPMCNLTIIKQALAEIKEIK